MPIISKFNRAARKEASGYLIDGKQVGSGVQCVHCGAHWVHQPGSGIERGWCFKCQGPLCGKAKCMADCVPLLARVEFEEGVRNKYWDIIQERGLGLL